MIRFAWLQSRTRTLLAAAAVAALAAAAAVTGIQLSSLYDRLVAHCRSDCGLATTQFLSHDQFLQSALNPLMQVLPALLGMFWGAPLLARELETGTFRLAWTQSVTRSRWLVSKLCVNGLAAALLAGVVTVTVTWWYRAGDLVSSNRFAVFDRRDLAPVGYALFAFALGALLGAVLRRTLPAMAATLGVFIAARVATTLWLRPHLLPPARSVTSLLHAGFGFVSENGSPVTMVAIGSGPPGGWTLSTSFVTRSGHVAGSAELARFVHHYCSAIATPPHGSPGQAPANAPAEFEACRRQAAHTFHLLITYQPAGRYWVLQWIEFGIFAALALLAATGCYWWVTRRTG